MRRTPDTLAWRLFALTILAQARAASGGACDAPNVYGALRDEPHVRVEVDGASIDVVFEDKDEPLDHTLVRQWIRTSAAAVAHYFGQFPVKHAGLVLVGAEGDRVMSGTTYGFDGSATCVRVGRDAGAETFRQDWVLVHEMTHLALPVVPRESEWLLEGNATYVEPIARAQIGQLDVAMVWRWAIEGLPKGLPQSGDRGLDHTPTWGRTYWGGALFWLLADIRIQQQSNGRFGVQDALRAINKKSGGNIARWSVDEVARVGDAATHTHVLADLYHEMKDAPMSIDLAHLFEQLGVAEKNGAVVFDDGAPLSTIRRRITSASAGKSLQ